MFNTNHNPIYIKRRLIKMRKSLLAFLCTIFFITTMALAKQMDQFNSEVTMLAKRLEQLSLQNEKLYIIIQNVQKIDQAVLTQNNKILKDVVKSNYFFVDFNIFLGCCAVIVVTAVLWVYLEKHHRSIFNALDRTEQNISDQIDSVSNQVDNAFDKIDKIDIDVSKSAKLLGVADQKLDSISSAVDMSLTSSNIETAQTIANVIQNTTS